MLPTEQEKQWLKDYLYEALTYRETFDEVYDHILLALEHKKAEPFFEGTVFKIIDEDFGGSTNMLNMEVDCKSTTNREFKAAYFRTLFSWLKPPRLVYTVVFFYAVIFIAFINKNKAVGLGLIIFLILISIIIPLVFLVLRSFKSKPSIKDSAFKRLVWGFFLADMFIIGPVFKLLNSFLTMALYHKAPKAYPHNPVNYVFFSIGSVIVIIHVLTLIKIYRDEFKTKMIKA
jgi:hypothetical protein